MALVGREVQTSISRPRFREIMGGKKEKDSLVARWRIRGDIEKANDKILSWAWQNDVPWYGHPLEGWIKPEGPNFCDESVDNGSFKEAAEEVPLLEPGEIEILDMIVKEEDETLCPATEQDFSANMQMSEGDAVIKRENRILCPADAQCEAANVQLFESIFKKEVCVYSTEEEIALGERKLEIRNLLNRDILEGPPQIKMKKRTLTLKRIGGLRCQFRSLNILRRTSCLGGRLLSFASSANQ